MTIPARLRRRFLPTAGRHSSQRRLFDSMEGNIVEYLFCQDLLRSKISLDNTKYCGKFSNIAYI
jgi:hypothetical protein